MLLLLLLHLWKPSIVSEVPIYTHVAEACDAERTLERMRFAREFDPGFSSN